MGIEGSLGILARTEPGGREAGRVRAIVVLLALLVGACGSQTSPAPSSSPNASPIASVSASPSPPPESADVIFTDANVVTMDDAHPNAQAVAVKGDTIMAVGTNQEIAKLQGPGTAVVSLAGKTLVPGFIDAHEHRIGDGPHALGLDSPKPLIDAAIEQGYTTIDELYVDQGRLDQLRDLDQSGVLRLRVNAYLPVQENSPEGKLLGDYFDAYQQGQMVSPHVRVAGLKVFTDFANATILLWKQADLNAFLLKEYKKGWHLAVKTVSTKSLAMILKAFQSVQAADPSVVDARGRLEHELFATAGQIAAIKALGLTPIINLNMPGQAVGEPDIAALIASEPKGSYVPWGSLFKAGIPAAGMTGFPSFYADEPTGAPFGSPIHLIYQGVTRAGNLGVQSPAALLGEALTADQAMRAMTINAARAGWEDDTKGSITVGKLADLVVLSGDPLTVAAKQINDIDVLMTMIGGKVEWCAPGSEAACPVPGSGGGSAATPTPGGGVTVTASASLPGNPPANAVDGNPDTFWSAGPGAPPEQWIQLDLGAARAEGAIRLVVAQSQAGGTSHQIWVGDSESELRLISEIKGSTEDGQEIRYTIPSSQGSFRYVRIVTTFDQSPVAWREIELIAP